MSLETRKGKFFSILAFIVLILVFLPALVQSEKNELDSELRQSVPGRFLRLSDGYTRYLDSGPRNGEVVVLVHGFSVPSFIWQRTVKSLNSAGFRTLRYDIYGRGYSDRPAKDYNRQLFRKQLSDFIMRTIPGQKFHLAGISMGGAIAIDYAARNHEQLKSLILLAPFALEQKQPLSMVLVRMPLLGEYIMHTVGGVILKSRLEKMYRNLESPDPEFISLFDKQMRIKGYRFALLSTMRHFLSNRFDDDLKKLGRFELKKMLIWGRNDKVVDYENSARFAGYYQPDVFLRLESGHTPMLEKPDIVHPAMIEFLKQ